MNLELTVICVGGPLNGQDRKVHRLACGTIAPSFIVRDFSQGKMTMHEYVVQQLAIDNSRKVAYVAIHSQMTLSQAATEVELNHLQKVVDSLEFLC